MRDKGLGKYAKAVMDCVVPLYDGERVVRMGFRQGDTVLVPGVKPESSLALQPGRPKLSLVTHGAGSVCNELPTGFLSPQTGSYNTRRPSMSERVVVVGRDACSPYLSERELEVRSVALDGKSFIIEDFSQDQVFEFRGGAVMAVVDGALLGFCLRRQFDKGDYEGYRCATFLTDVTQPKPTLGDVVSRRFPYLTPGLWPEMVCEEVVTHSSVGKYRDGRTFNSGMSPLAYIGDAVLKDYGGRTLREADVPVAEWQQRIQRVQSNVRLADACQLSGLATTLVVGKGVNLHPGAKAYADLLEAFVGAVSLHEDPGKLRRFLSECDLLPTTEALRPSTA